MSAVGTLSVRLLGDMSGLSRSLDQSGKEISAFQAKIDKAGQQIGTAVKRGAAVATAALVALGVSATKTAIEFENGMLEVFTLLPEITEDARKQMEADVKELARTINVVPTKLIPALYQAISAGIPKDNVFEFLEVAGKAAIAGVTELEVAVDGLTSAVNAYGAEILPVEEAADIMFTAVKRGKTTFEELSQRLFQAVPIAAKIGLEFRNVAGAAAQVTLAGVPMQIAMTQIRSLLNEVAFEGKELNKVFVEAAGVSFQEYIGAGHDIADVIEVLEGAARDAGKSIAEMTGNVEAQGALLNLSGEALNSLRGILDEMANSTGATDVAYGTMAEGIQHSLNGLKVFVENLKLRIGEPMVESLNTLLVWLKANEDAIADAITGLFDKMLGALDWLTANAGLVKAAGITIAAGLTAIWTAANPVAGAVIALTSSLTWFTSLGGIAGVYANIQQLARGIRSLVFGEEEAVVVTEAVVKALEDALVESGFKVQDMLDALQDALVATPAEVGAAWKAVEEAQRKALEDLKKGVRFDFVLLEYKKTVTAILEQNGMLIGDAETTYGAIIDAALESWSEITGVVVGSTEEQASALEEYAEDAVDALGQVDAALEEHADEAEEAASRWAQAFSRMKETVTEQAKGMSLTVEEATKKLMSALETAFAGFFDGILGMKETNAQLMEDYNETIEKLGEAQGEAVRKAADDRREAQRQLVKDLEDGKLTREQYAREYADIENTYTQAVRDANDERERLAGEALQVYEDEKASIWTVLKDTVKNFLKAAKQELIIQAAKHAAIAAAMAFTLNPLAIGHAKAAGAYLVGAALVGGLASFDKGGIVAGALGEPQIIMAHGGEAVLTPGQQESLFDYPRFAEAVSAGVYDAMNDILPGKERPIILTLDGTRVARAMFPALQREEQRLGLVTT
jgi:TP901 family phage tail tape measure protein